MPRGLLTGARGSVFSKKRNSNNAFESIGDKLRNTANTTANVMNTRSGNNANAGTTAQSGTSTLGNTINGIDYNKYRNNSSMAYQQAYNNNMKNVSGIYDSSKSNLTDQYNNASQSLDAVYNQNLSQIKRDAENSMRDYYVDNQIQNRDLQQNLTAQGLSGGASETTQASMRNNYQNNRADVQSQLTDKTAELQAAYQGDLSSVESNYQNGLSALEQQRAAQEAQYNSDLANNITSNYTNYQDMLANLDTSMYGANLSAFNSLYARDPVQATNFAELVNTQQANNNIANNDSYIDFLLSQYGDDATAQNYASTANDAYAQMYNYLYGGR